MGLDASRGTPRHYIEAGFIVMWALQISAIVGVVVLRRRGEPVYLLLAFIASVILGIALTYGQTRFRAPAEVPLALLAAVAIDGVFRHLRADHLVENARDARA